MRTEALPQHEGTKTPRHKKWNMQYGELRYVPEAEDPRAGADAVVHRVHCVHYVHYVHYVHWVLS